MIRLSAAAERPHVLELARGPQVRALLEEADVHPLEAEHGDQPERLLVGQEREGKSAQASLGFMEDRPAG